MSGEGRDGGTQDASHTRNQVHRAGIREIHADDDHRRRDHGIGDGNGQRRVHGRHANERQQTACHCDRFDHPSRLLRHVDEPCGNGSQLVGGRIQLIGRARGFQRQILDVLLGAIAVERSCQHVIGREISAELL